MNSISSGYEKMDVNFCYDAILEIGFFDYWLDKSRM